jgi:hypothetical protein
MKVRETYIKKRELRELRALGNKRKIQTKAEQFKDKIFPLTYRNAKTMWRRMVNKSGFGRIYDDNGEFIEDKNLDRTTMRSKIHPHMLRKYFRTYLAAVHVEGVNSLDAVEVLMGHEGYLTKSYRRMSESQLRTFYKGSEHAVTINTVTTSKGSAIQDDELLKIKRQIDVMMEQHAKPSTQEIDFAQLKNNPVFQQWLKREFLLADGNAEKEYGLAN